MAETPDPADWVVMSVAARPATVKAHRPDDGDKFGSECPALDDAEQVARFRWAGVPAETGLCWACWGNPLDRADLDGVAP